MAKELTQIFFDNWYCDNGLPLDIISNRDKLFVSKFWKALHVLTGTKIKMSSSYHPETDGSSECTNKMVNQMLRYHVEHNQLGWVHALPLVCFNIMNTINKSMGFLPFQLCMGCSPHIIPPLIEWEAQDTTPKAQRTYELIKKLEQISMEAQDNLLWAKISWAAQANKSRTLTFPFSVGGRVHLKTLHRQHEYQGSGEKCVAKFMLQYDGPYTIIDIDKDDSIVTLDLPNSPNIFPTFHTSEVVPYVKNDMTLFSNWEFSRLPAVTMEDGSEECFICNIIDKQCCGCGYCYLVWWVRYGAEENRWLKGTDLKDTEALDIWLAKCRIGMDFVSTILLLPRPAGSFPTGFWCTRAVHCNYCFLLTTLLQLFLFFFSFHFYFFRRGEC